MIYENPNKPSKVLLLNKGFACIIDAEDFKRVSRYKWFVHFSRGRNRKLGKPYVRASINGKKVLLHRYLISVFESNLQVDHINQQTLDNRKVNLRITTNLENQRNKRIKPL